MGILGLALLGTAATANAAPPGDAAEVHAASTATAPDSAHKVGASRGEKGAAESQTRPDRGHWPGKGDKPDKGDWPGKGDKDECEEPEKPPVVEPEKPPVEEPEKPPVEEPVMPPAETVTPPAETVTPPAETVTPPAPAVTPPAGAAQGQAAVVNVGYNVQTAAAGTVDAGIPLWLSVLTGLLTAGAATGLLRGMARARHADS
jgi:hypothetical protein